MVVRSGQGRRGEVVKDLADAYTQGASAWAEGPARVYGPLAERLIAFSPRPLTDASVLDLGSGTGVGSRAALAAGARVVAADLSAGMLLLDRSTRPPAAAGDATALPFRNDAFDVVLAPFSLNHLHDPALGVREAARVADHLLASTYAADDDHPAKLAVETALTELGWQRPNWYDGIKAAMSAWGTVDVARDVVERGGMRPVRMEHETVVFDDLGPEDMVAWRAGVAPSAAFLGALPPAQRESFVARALELLGPNPPLIERRVILISAARQT